MSTDVDSFFDKLTTWKTEMSALRTILLDTGLIEDYKWMHPCYTYKGSNIVLIHRFKEYCALSFFNGVLLADTENILIQPTENSQTGRQIRFTDVKQIQEKKATIKAYIYESIELEKAGIKLELKKTTDFETPKELEQKFQEDATFKDAFEALTPGRQRGYLLHFSQAKQSKSRTARIEKYTTRIFDGKGIRDCVCGHSKRMPNCDGSHKHYE